MIVSHKSHFSDSTKCYFNESAVWRPVKQPKKQHILKWPDIFSNYTNTHLHTVNQQSL